jgi:hypothetical protein
LATSYTALQALNPIAALTAVTVAVIGFVWFRKTSHLMNVIFYDSVLRSEQQAIEQLLLA